MICPNCHAALPDQLQVCFRCGSHLAADRHPHNQSPDTPPAPDKRGKRKGALLLLPLLLIGVGLGGHLAGLYALPFLPAPNAQVGEGRVDAEAALAELTPVPVIDGSTLEELQGEIVEQEETRPPEQTRPLDVDIELEVFSPWEASFAVSGFPLGEEYPLAPAGAEELELIYRWHIRFGDYEAGISQACYDTEDTGWVSPMDMQHSLWKRDGDGLQIVNDGFISLSVYDGILYMYLALPDDADVDFTSYDGYTYEYVNRETGEQSTGDCSMEFYDFAAAIAARNLTGYEKDETWYVQRVASHPRYCAGQWLREDGMAVLYIHDYNAQSRSFEFELLVEGANDQGSSVLIDVYAYLDDEELGAGAYDNDLYFQALEDGTLYLSSGATSAEIHKDYNIASPDGIYVMTRKRNW